MSGIEDVDGMDAVRFALDRAEDRRIIARRIHRDLTHPPRVARTHWLVRRYSGLAFRTIRPEVPFGWTTRREWDRDCFSIMPCWLAWPRDLWRARWGVFRLAMRFGLWTVPVEGDYYVNGRLTAPRWLRRVPAPGRSDDMKESAPVPSFGR